MMPITRLRTRPSAATPLLDVFLAFVVAIILVVATVRGDAPRTGLARSANYIVWADSQPEADRLIQRAEAWRRQLAIQWLGAPLPDGAGRASLNVTVSHRDAAHAWLADTSSGAGHLVWLDTPPEKLDHALAHEIAHLVLATRWPDLPPFAQEGIAGRYDDDERLAIRRRALRGFVETDRWPRLHDLLRARSISPTDRSGYAAAGSLVDFLLSAALARDATSRAPAESDKIRAAAVLFAFAVEGSRGGRWDEAAARHYGFADLAELEQAWRMHVRAGMDRAARRARAAEAELALRPR